MPNNLHVIGEISAELEPLIDSDHATTRYAWLTLVAGETGEALRMDWRARRADDDRPDC